MRGGTHMPEKDSQQQGTRVPQGFTVHSSGLASEYAREQGWGINEEERSKTPRQKQNYDGGTDYDYGARDFGEEPLDTRSSGPAAERNKQRPSAQKRRAA
jgi:hypothetical protein